MLAERLKLDLFAPNKLCGGRTVKYSKIPHYAYTWPFKSIFVSVSSSNKKTMRNILFPLFALGLFSCQSNNKAGPQLEDNIFLVQKMAFNGEV
jgi:hypothetical protein